MHISFSFLTSILILSFSDKAQARTAHHRAGLNGENNNASKERKPENRGIPYIWPLSNFFGRRQLQDQDLDCSTPDVYLDLLNNGQEDDVQTFCNKWLGLPQATTVVEVTPTITATTSGAKTHTIVQTTRVLTTETVLRSLAVAPVPIARRAAKIAAKIAAANDIISSVIASGTDASTLSSPQSTGHIEAVSGLYSACSCKNVDPTSTTTLTFTAPAVQATVGKNKLRLVTIYSTKTYTTTAIIAPSSIPSVNSATSLNSSASGSTRGFSTSRMTPLSFDDIQLSNGSLSVNAATAMVGASIASAPSITLIPTSSKISMAIPPETSLPVVVGIPFSCPKNNGETPHFIVGDLRFEYSVQCDTAFVTGDDVVAIRNVLDQTACAVECSLINNAAQENICKAALFTVIPGVTAGSCLISGSPTNIVNEPGSTTILLTSVSSKNDHCTSIDLTKELSNITTINTEAFKDSVTPAGYSLSIPGLLSKSATGGVSRSTYSSGYTDANGWYHWSAFEVYASSSVWWEVYATSWSCTANIPQTVVRHEFAPSATSVLVDITTIINNGSITTVISGTSSVIISNGGGSSSLTSIIASTTGSHQVFTIGSSTGTSTASAGGGAQGPSPTTVTSLTDDTQPGVNGTAVTLSGTVSQGSALVMLSGKPAIVNSTITLALATSTSITARQSESNGSVMNPSVALFSGTSTILFDNSTAIRGSLQALQSVVAAEAIVSGALSIVTSDRMSGAIPTSATNGKFAATISSSAAAWNSTGLRGSQSFSPTFGRASLSHSSSTTIWNNTDDSGGYRSQGTYTGANTPSNSTFSKDEEEEGWWGAARVTVSSETLTFISSRTAGVYSVGSPVNATTLPADAVPSANAQSASIRNTSIALSTGGDFSGPVLITSNSSHASTPSLGTAFTSTISSVNFSPQLPTNFSGATSESLASVISLDNSLPSAGAGLISISGATALIATVASFGVTSTSSQLETVPTSLISSLISNGSISSGEMAGTLTTSNRTSLVFAASVSEARSLSQTLVASIGFSLNTSPGINTSRTWDGASPVPTGMLNVSLPEDIGFILATGTTGAISPFAYKTTTTPVGLTLSLSVHVPSTTSIGFNNSLRDRTGALHSTTRVNMTRSGTSPFETDISRSSASSTVPPNWSVFSAMEASISTINGGYGDNQPAKVSIFFTSANITSIPGSGQLSATPPPIPVNLSSILPIDGTTRLPFSNDDDDRLGRGRSPSRSSSFSSAMTVPTTSIALWTGTTSYMASSSSVPNLSINSSLPIYLNASLLTPINVTMLPVDAGLASTTASSSNTTAIILTITPSSMNLEMLSNLAVPSPVNLTKLPGTASSGFETAATTEDEYGGWGIAATVTTIVATPIGTSPSAIPPPFINASISDGPRSGLFLRPSSNSTAQLPTETTPSIAPLDNVSNSLPQASTNTTILLLTNTEKLSGIPAISANSSIIIGSASEAAPTPFLGALASMSNSIITLNFAPTRDAGASTVPTLSANSTFPPLISETTSFTIPTVLTNTSSYDGAASSSIPTLSTNSSGVFSIETDTVRGRSTGFSAWSLNATIPVFNLSSVPSATPVISPNSSQETCPTVASYSVLAHTAVITTVSYETVPVRQSTCIPSSPLHLTFNGTVTTDAPALPLGAFSSAAFNVVAPSAALAPTPAASRYRRTGEVATQEQIDTACADKKNLLFNPGFRPKTDDTTFGWTTVPEDDFISFETVQLAGKDGTSERFVRVLTAAAGRSITITQPLTLCPRKQYELSSSNRQGDLLAKCTLEYAIGDDSIYIASPQEAFLKTERFFTAGESNEEASVDFKIRIKCDGEAGAPAGANEEGFMIAEFMGVGVVQV